MTVEPITLDYLLDMLSNYEFPDMPSSTDTMLIQTTARMAQAYIGSLKEGYDTMREMVNTAMGIQVV